jgi:hypothetical protein
LKANGFLSGFNFQNLYKAYLDCRKHKRKTYHAAKFEINFESELLKLERELQNHTYKPGRSICFVIEEPTLREVFAATFRDRVIHHLLYNFLEPVFEPKFIDQSYACRKKKGTHQSLKDLQKYLRKITQNHRRKTYFMHLDIQGFFMSLKKDILFNLISKQIRNPEFLWLAKIIIFNDPIKNFTFKGDESLFDKIPFHKSLFHVPKNQGLPIGNLTSQFFANIYLNELDQFAKHHLKTKYYIRYVDDFLILSADKNQLKEWRNQIIYFLKQYLGLNLNLQKQIIQTNDKGINWLGYIVKPNHILIRRRTVKALKRKLFSFNQKILNLNLEHPIRLWTPELCKNFKKIFAVINSYYGFLKCANTFRLRRHIYEKHFGILKIYLIPADKKYNYFIWSND